MYGRPRPAGHFSSIPIRDIEPNPDQPRQEFDPLALANLATSIRQHGLLQPVVLRLIPHDGKDLYPSATARLSTGNISTRQSAAPEKDQSAGPSQWESPQSGLSQSGLPPSGPPQHRNPEHRNLDQHSDNAGSRPRYHLIAGERRWRAAQLAGLHEIPAILIEATPPQLLELALVENLQRADLSPLEEARAYDHMIRHLRLTQEEVALRVGRSRVAIANRLRLLNLTPTTRAALNDQRITEGHARALLALSGSEQEAALATVLRERLSVRETERLVRRQVTGVRSPSTGSGSHHSDVIPVQPAVESALDTRRLEDAFRRALGTKVELSRQGAAGKLVVEFFSDEELERLFAIIVGTSLDDEDH